MKMLLRASVISAVLFPSPAAHAQPIDLKQNWSVDESREFWWKSQGSRLMPYHWFVVLEQPGSTAPFAAADNMRALGYIPQPASTENPGALPIGFALDVAKKQDGSKAVGFTCAACHTRELQIAGKSVIIEGGPTLADFSRFMTELVAAI